MKPILTDAEMGPPPAVLTDEEMGPPPAPAPAAQAAPSPPEGGLSGFAHRILGPNIGARLKEGGKQAINGVNSMIDSGTLGAYGGIQRLVGDPFGAAKGIDEYRAEHPYLSVITDAPAYLEGSAPAAKAMKTIEEAIPQAVTKAGQIARTALASAGFGGATSAAQSAAHGEGLPDIAESTARGAGSGLLAGTFLGTAAQALGGVGRLVENSRGGQARKLLNSYDVQVGPMTPGIGGPFKDELAGLTPDSAGEGEAAMRGSRRLLEQHTQAWHDQTSQPEEFYRKPVGEREAELKAQAKEAVGPAPRYDQQAAMPAAAQKLDEIEASHASRKAPILAKQAETDALSEEMPKRDVTDLRNQVVEQIYSPRTTPNAAAKLQRGLDILDRYRDRGTATDAEREQFKNLTEMRGKLPTNHPAARQLDSMLAELQPKMGTGKILMSERDLNDLRHNVFQGTSMGTSDVRSAREAPQRNLGYALKSAVDEGPYADVNQDWAKAYEAQRADRKAAGLRKRAPSDRDTDVERIARKDARAKYLADQATHAKAKDKAALDTAVDLGDFELAKDVARTPRLQLGLNENIPTRSAVDEERLKLRLLDRTKDTHTAGGKASYKGTEGPSLDDYTNENPDAQRFVDFPALAQARNRLTLGINVHGGDLLSTTKKIVKLNSLPGYLRLAALNASPIAGRGLYGPALEAKFAGETGIPSAAPIFAGARNAHRKKKDEK